MFLASSRKLLRSGILDLYRRIENTRSHRPHTCCPAKTLQWDKCGVNLVVQIRLWVRVCVGRLFLWRNGFRILRLETSNRKGERIHCQPWMFCVDSSWSFQNPPPSCLPPPNPLENEHHTDLPVGRTPAEVTAVLIHTCPAVPARVTRAFVRRQKPLKSLKLIFQTVNLTG